MPKILIADDDPVLRELLTNFFRRQTYEVTAVKDGNEAVEAARKVQPDLIVLDVSMPKKDGLEACRELRADVTTRFIPILFLTANVEAQDRLAGLSLGADDYLAKPFDPQELKVRVGGLLTRSRMALGANPLTRLPGGALIEEEASRRLAARKHFAFAYIDIDNFKVYNDLYGYHKGDEVIRCVAHLLVEAVAKKGREGDFVGHIGGDDFVLVTAPVSIKPVAQYLIKHFDSRAPSFYKGEHRRLGFVQTLDRHGARRRFPLVSLSVAIVTNQKRVIGHYAQLVEIATELKRYAKTRLDRKGSLIAEDRRGGKIKKK